MLLDNRRKLRLNCELDFYCVYKYKFFRRNTELASRLHMMMKNTPLSLVGKQKSQ